MRTSLSVLALLGSVLAAQQSSQLHSCVAFNDVAGAVPTVVDCCNTQVSVSFTAPSAFTLTEIEVYAVLNQGMIASVSESAGGLSVSGTVTPGIVGPSSVARWITVMVAPLAVTAGATCTVSVQPTVLSPTIGNYLTLYANPNGGAPLLLSRNCLPTVPCPGSTPCGQAPTLVTLMFRLRGPACTGGSPAVLTAVGSGCGTPIAPHLGASAFPVVADQFFYLQLSNAAPAGALAHLFLAEGAATSGTPVEPGHPCLIHLAPASLAYLTALGYEPLASAPINPISAFFNMPIPSLPWLIGLTVTFQAAILDPSGGFPLSTVPGVSLKASNGLTLTIGA